MKRIFFKKGKITIIKVIATSMALVGTLAGCAVFNNSSKKDAQSGTSIGPIDNFDGSNDNPFDPEEQTIDFAQQNILADSNFDCNDQTERVKRVNACYDEAYDLSNVNTNISNGTVGLNLSKADIDKLYLIINNMDVVSEYPNADITENLFRPIDNIVLANSSVVENYNETLKGDQPTMLDLSSLVADKEDAKLIEYACSINNQVVTLIVNNQIDEAKEVLNEYLASIHSLFEQNSNIMLDNQDYSESDFSEIAKLIVSKYAMAAISLSERNCNMFDIRYQALARDGVLDDCIIPLSANYLNTPDGAYLKQCMKQTVADSNTKEAQEAGMKALTYNELINGYAESTFFGTCLRSMEVASQFIYIKYDHTCQPKTYIK